MKRWIILFLTLPLFTMINAQSRHLSLYEYWLDNDYDSRVSQSLSQLQENINFSINASEMVEGMHSVNVRVQDNEGNWSSITREQFLVFQISQTATPQLTTYEYWIDGDYEQRKTASVANGNVSFAIECSSLGVGLHNISCRIKDSNNNASGIICAYFFVCPTWENGTGEIVSCEYWIDGDKENLKEIAVNGSNIAFAIDATDLEEGKHTISMRIKNDMGEYSSILTDLFFKFKAEAEAGTPTTCEYWIDGDKENLKEIAVNGSNIAFAIDATDLGEGKHTISMCVKDDLGEYSSILTDIFFKFKAEAEAGTPTTCEYWTDQDFANRKTVSVTDGSVAFTIDASAQPDGMHQISWRILDDKGNFGALNSSSYYKYTPVMPAEDIVWYQYWWNDRSDLGVRKEVTTKGLLSMDEIFEVPDYVVNTKGLETGTAEFHILFANNQGNISSITTEIVTDKIPPTSSMDELPETQVTSMQTISWKGIDKWAGVKDYTIYLYDEEDGQWKVHEENTTETSLQFYCSRYDYVAKFFVIARDSLDNVEPMKTEAEAQVRFMYVDIYPPKTKLEVSNETVNAGKSVELNWISADDVHEVKKNNIYYSEDDGPLVLWKTVTDTTSVTFRGRKGTTYKFVVTGQDTEGNQESPDISNAISVHFNN